MCARTPGENYYKTGVDPDGVGYVNQHGLSRKHIFDSVRNSLKRLQLDYIDLLQCRPSVVHSMLEMTTYLHILAGHRSDPDTPFEETVRRLTPLSLYKY